MTPTPSAEEGLRLAVALLGEALDADGVEEQAWALVFASGVVVDEGSDPWRPVPSEPHPAAAHMVAPGTANYAILRRMQLEEPLRIRYTCADLSLVERAKADPVARRAAQLLAEALQFRGAAVPEALAACLAGEGKTRRHGPNPAKRSPRNRAIVHTILGLHACGFEPHLGEGKLCGLTLVQAALERLGAKPILSYEGARTIWRDHGLSAQALARSVHGPTK